MPIEIRQVSGYEELERWVEAQLFLELGTHSPADPVLPDGVELAWLSERPDLLEALFEIAVATGRDRTGSFPAWQVYELGDPRTRLDLTAIGLAGDKAIGYTTFVQLADERTGGHRVLAVLPAWTDQGIGAAMTRAQIAAAKHAGLERLFAWARPWQHHDLYESLGYTARTESIDFQGPLQ
jgi:GNAT superfamily N-acetyltransferase